MFRKKSIYFCEVVYLLLDVIKFLVFYWCVFNVWKFDYIWLVLFGYVMNIDCFVVVWVCEDGLNVVIIGCVLVQDWWFGFIGVICVFLVQDCCDYWK